MKAVELITPVPAAENAPALGPQNRPNSAFNSGRSHRRWRGAAAAWLVSPGPVLEVLPPQIRGAAHFSMFGRRPHTGVPPWGHRHRSAGRWVAKSAGWRSAEAPTRPRAAPPTRTVGREPRGPIPTLFFSGRPRGALWSTQARIGPHGSARRGPARATPRAVGGHLRLCGHLRRALSRLGGAAGAHGRARARRSSSRDLARSRRELGGGR